jgi:hypothetical protein
LPILQAMKALRENRGKLVLCCLDLGTRRGQRQAPAIFYPQNRPGTHCTGGWVGPRASLDSCGKSRPHRVRSSDRPARCQFLYRLSYSAHTPRTCRYLFVPVKCYVRRTQRISAVCVVAMYNFQFPKMYLPHDWQSCQILHTC